MTDRFQVTGVRYYQPESYLMMSISTVMKILPLVCVYVREGEGKSEYLTSIH